MISKEINSDIMVRTKGIFMSEMQLITDSKTCDINWQELAELIARAGLGERDPVKLKRAYDNAQFVWFGFVDGRLMATAHAISDFTYASYLSDVVVDVDFQGKGYGGALMKAIMSTLAPCGKVFIYAMPDKISFYQRLGYASLTTGMIFAEGSALMRLQEGGFIAG